MTQAATTPRADKIIIVDDDARIRDLLRRYLAQEGFEVILAEDGKALNRILLRDAVDLIVLDLMMPGEDGFSLARWLRGRSGTSAATPILMLTARGLPEDRIEGLSLGADDYLSKPFEPQELLLRIEAILRRANARPTGQERLKLGRCTFDLDRAELFVGDEPVRLTEAEAQLLKQLAQSPNLAIDRMDLARDTADATGRAVDVQVTRLRRKIESDPKNPRYLQTVRGVGYMLAPD